MANDLWQRFRSHLTVHDDLGLRLDISRMAFADDYFATMAAPMARAYDAMAALEAGEIANPDEGRQVGHYWLRAPRLAPRAEIGAAIETEVARIQSFAADVHSGRVAPPRAPRFTELLVVGIGGSALGPQLVADALGAPGRDPLTVWFFDNTDPDGMERILQRLGPRLGRTLCVVISKSGGTPETRNGMLVAQAAFAAAGLDFATHAVAVTGVGSALDRTAVEEGWRARFPMWDWVGGRTSVSSAVGLLPAALQGLDVEALLAGAAAADAVTRRRETAHNPAALMALMWYHASGGRGAKDMVILPYKDRLLLLSRYLQQLIMESLGKAEDLDGRPVAQGLTVYGNKGSTDQHAYVQQLRDGVDNFFITFIEVLEDGGSELEVEPGMRCGDYLRGFYLGTREALHARGRDAMTLTVERVDAHTLGVLIALFERAVGFYASLVNINAYHQPGVEAGKRAAVAVLQLQRQVVAHLAAQSAPQTAEEIAAALGTPERAETVFHLLEGLVVNGRDVGKEPGPQPWAARYWMTS